MTIADLPTDIESLQHHYAEGGKPDDVIDAVFARIQGADDPGIFITLVSHDHARAAAEALGQYDPASKPLWGVPFAVKDNIDVAGLPTTAAAPRFAHMPARTAFAVQRLLDAGAILIGKTNLDQFAAGLVGVRTPYPVPRNAIDPTIVPGGSSSGSAVAVARGLVSFALGTDTAGSGRVPAGLNNIVGLKPSVGAVSTRGVLPACRTLDCVSVFALTVDDAWRVFDVMAGMDADDDYSRPIEREAIRPVPPRSVIGVPRQADLRFFGDEAAAAAWAQATRLLEGMGARLVDVDMTPFFETAALLYEGPWVAERFAAIRDFIASSAPDMHPVTLGIIDTAMKFSAVDAFQGIYRLASLKRRVEPMLSSIDALAVPTAPLSPTLKDLETDPIGPNSKLGTYTNFVNLLDMCGIAVPGPFRSDGRAAGITLLGRRGSDASLASFGRQFHARSNVPFGATRRAPPIERPLEAALPAGYIPIVVVGAHMSGMPLNGELKDLGARFMRAAETAPAYRLFALPGGPPARPGLVRVGASGCSIATEVWALPAASFARFVAGIPSPLGIGTITLQDGAAVKGFLCETIGLEGAADISSFGGWRAYIESRK